ncbi:MAG: hypothetical protein JWM11_1614 [Planctomycetaceae bacterium]|nr:hypothetical protein [Planctomycetaceae bacterium]
MQYAAVITFLACSISDAPKVVDTQPTAADFISVEAQDSFKSVKVPQYWGTEENSWHVAFRLSTKKQSFVVDGGYGEVVPLAMTVFTSDPAWQRWSNWKSLRILLTVQAAGMPDFERTASAWSSGFQGNKFGSCWEVPNGLPIEELRQFWGRVPETILVKATLSDEQLPPAASATVPIELVPVSRQAASWYRKLQSLRKGQSKQEIIKLLGTPSSTRPITKGNVNYIQALIYPNPDAPVHLPASKRNTEIHFDSDGEFVRYFHTSLGC